MSAEALKKDDDFVWNILFLLASADEACVGVGLAEQGQSGDFELQAELRLSLTGNLVCRLPSDTIRVLPKLHTPQSGLNIRSLSHHLSLCSANEVRAKWTVAGISTRERSSILSFLLAPWPLRSGSGVYRESAIKSKNSNDFGYFDYCPSGSGEVVAWLEDRLNVAQNEGHKLDLVIFPECALTSKEWIAAAKACAARGVGLVAGVHVKQSRGKRARNLVRMRLPFVFEDIEQDKHHRWQLNGAQIKTYSLGESFSGDKVWWENIEIRERNLHFVNFNPDLTMCTLVCEDLARQEPVAEMVRAVGPNLVVALLSDGPQINGRWPSRYASVLADDPGCSVLTLSSLGMVERSRLGGGPVNRTIASWRDFKGGFTPIDLGVGEDAVVVDVKIKRSVEWSVDGRSDGEVAAYPSLVGLHGLGVAS